MTRNPVNQWTRRCAILFLFPTLLIAAGLGCADDDDPVIEPLTPLVTEDDVLDRLQFAWTARDIDAYAGMLADDFRYFPDPYTRQELNLESWDRTRELAYINCLFNSNDIRKIAIELGWSHRSAAPAGFFGPRASWTRLFLTDVFLDIDVAPPDEEVNTHRVEDQTQRFFFRKGRTSPPSGPGDTLMYLVEWRDDGGNEGRKSQFQAVLPTSWSQLKILARECATYPSEPPTKYLPQTSEDNVLHNLQEAIKVRNPSEYAKLFSEDYRFYFDPKTRSSLGIEYWDREAEQSSVTCLFNDPNVTRTVIELHWPPGSATSAGFLAPREGWKKLVISDVFLDVDYTPSGQPTTTFRVEDQTQRFFFRKGRTYPPSGPADTLTYIVEWRDEGSAYKGHHVEPGSWSRIKTLCN